jgi:hypothetical protein
MSTKFKEGEQEEEEKKMKKKKIKSPQGVLEEVWILHRRLK